MDMNLSKLWEIVEDRGAWYATVHEVAKSLLQISDWTRTTTAKLEGINSVLAWCSAYTRNILTLALKVFNDHSLVNSTISTIQLSSVQFSHSVVSDSLRPHESQHARPSCPSPTPGVHSNSCPSSRWWNPALSSSVIPFSSCPQSLPASESCPMSQLFALGDQSTGISALASFLPKNTQDWSPLQWTGWISLQPKGLSRVFSNTTVQKHQFFSTQLLSQSNSHIHTWPEEKP